MTAWARVREKIAQAAPGLGRALDLPGAELAGNLIGRALGVEPTPDAIEAALAADPQALAKVEEAERQLEAAYLADRQNARAWHVDSIMPGLVFGILTAMVIAITGGLYFIEIPMQNRDMIAWIVPQVFTLWLASGYYWTGSSRGSAVKDARWYEQQERQAAAPLRVVVGGKT